MTPENAVLWNFGRTIARRSATRSQFRLDELIRRNGPVDDAWASASGVRIGAVGRVPALAGIVIDQMRSRSASRRTFSVLCSCPAVTVGVLAVRQLVRGEHDLPDSSQYGDSSHPSSRMRTVSGVSDLALHLWAILGSNQ